MLLEFDIVLIPLQILLLIVLHIYSTSVAKKLQEHMPKRIHVYWRALVEFLHVFAKLALARI